MSTLRRVTITGCIGMIRCNRAVINLQEFHQIGQREKGQDTHGKFRTQGRTYKILDVMRQDEFRHFIMQRNVDLPEEQQHVPHTASGECPVGDVPIFFVKEESEEQSQENRKAILTWSDAFGSLLPEEYKVTPHNILYEDWTKYGRSQNVQSWETEKVNYIATEKSDTVEQSRLPVIRNFR